MNGTFRSVHEPVLGTRLALRVDGHAAAAGEAEARVLAECERLEGLLSAFRPSSAWSRWRRGQLDTPPAEVVELLVLAAAWRQRSGGAFDPRAGAFLARWRRAAEDGAAPSADELAGLATGGDDLPYRVCTDGTVERRGECSHLDLHGLAKGWVADRAAAAAKQVDGVTGVVVNLGGDLVHRGEGGITVAIEDPRTPFDNAPPLVRVTVSNVGLASSSGARRPLLVGGQRVNHTVDPRTGRPVTAVLGASAIAPTCADADALATAAGVLAPAEAMALADSLAGCAVHVLDEHGQAWASTRWPTA